MEREKKWRNSSDGYHIESVTQPYEVIAYVADSQRLRHILACVNACYGIKDPEKTIKGLVDLLREINEQLPMPANYEMRIKAILKQLKE